MPVIAAITQQAPSKRRSAAGRHNAHKRHHGADDPQTQAAARELQYARVAEAIEAAVAQAPDLTPDQRQDLAALLQPAT